ncbi:MAG: hypothetical protein ACYTF2_17550 [Planctomycetota bacterium]|jgi:hypothetical protein
MRTSTIYLAAALMQLLGPRPDFVRTAYAEPAGPALTEVVIYGIDADTNQLLRYTFDTDPWGVIVVDACD